MATYRAKPTQATIQVSRARKLPGVAQRKPFTFALGLAQYRMAITTVTSTTAVGGVGRPRLRPDALLEHLQHGGQHGHGRSRDVNLITRAEERGDREGPGPQDPDPQRIDGAENARRGGVHVHGLHARPQEYRQGGGSHDRAALGQGGAEQIPGCSEDDGAGEQRQGQSDHCVRGGAVQAGGGDAASRTSARHSTIAGTTSARATVQTAASAASRAAA